MKITLKMIAEKLGVSVGTVHRAINNSGRINQETKRRILETANELGYKPNNIARALVLNKTINIAAVFPEEPRYFVEKIVRGMKVAENELGDYGIKIHFIHTKSMNPVEQKKALSNIDKDMFDGIILNAGGDMLSPYVNDFIENDIPLITFDSDLNASKRLFFVGQHSRKAGRIAAELMGKFVNGSGIVIMLTGFDSVFAHVERLKGFRNVIEKNYHNIQLGAEYFYHDNENEAYEIIREVLKNQRMVKGIYTTSAPGAIGVGRAIKNMSIFDVPVLIGFDVNEHVKELLEQEICTAVIYQDPFMQAYYSVKLLLRNILEGWLPDKESLYIRSKVVLKYNVEDYLSQEEKSFPDVISN